MDVASPNKQLSDGRSWHLALCTRIHLILNAWALTDRVVMMRIWTGTML